MARRHRGQVDLEMSFIGPEDIYRLIESLVARVWREFKGVSLTTPFRHMSYRDAIRKVWPVRGASGRRGPGPTTCVRRRGRGGGRARARASTAATSRTRGWAWWCGGACVRRRDGPSGR